VFDLFTGTPLLLDQLGLTGFKLYNKLSRDMFLNVGQEYENSKRFWDNMELCQAPNLDSNTTEKFCEENRHHDKDIVKVFGTSTPDSSKYILHYARGWRTNRHKTPVILVPGAGLDATSYADLFGMGFKGISQLLTDFGYRIFAVTFSHSHGDNFIQAEQLADAIAKVKEITGENQVDIIAHSKGGIAARVYLSDLGSTSFRGDVRKFIMLGVPNLGVDFSFRNPLFNYLVYISGSNGVMTWDKIMLFGNMVDVSEKAIYEDGAFPGQSQILYRWDDRYDLDVLQQDWWTTYYGGNGYISHSQGIDKAIKIGGMLIERLNKKGLEPGIKIAILAGNNSFFNAMPGESSGPSDGLVFTESAMYSDGLIRRGAVISDKIVLPVNHMELLYDPRVARWIDTQL